MRCHGPRYHLRLEEPGAQLYGVGFYSAKLPDRSLTACYCYNLRGEDLHTKLVPSLNNSYNENHHKTQRLAALILRLAFPAKLQRHSETKKANFAGCMALMKQKRLGRLTAASAKNSGTHYDQPLMR